MKRPRSSMRCGHQQRSEWSDVDPSTLQSSTDLITAETFQTCNTQSILFTHDGAFSQPDKLDSLDFMRFFLGFCRKHLFFFFCLWTKLNKNTSRSWYELTIKADTSFTHTHTYLVMQLYHWGFCSKLCTFILLNWPGGNPVGLGNIPYRLSG